MPERIVAGLTLAIWVYLTCAHGAFWTTSIRLPHGNRRHPDPTNWPTVVAIVPARDEAELLAVTLPSVLGQHYPGTLHVLLVDDDSSDGTGNIGRTVGAEVVRAGGPPTGWSGKVAAMSVGVAAAAERGWTPHWWWFTDADIQHGPDVLADLVRVGEGDGRDLVSVMARLRAASFWERWIVPAFVYFFAQLYPFRRVNGPGRTAAAAGECLLLRREALQAAGGLDRIGSALIDDVALARLVSGSGRLWLGLSDRVRSLRGYPRMSDLWSMVARSAYHQLRYSPGLLVATVAGLLLTYAAAPALAILGLTTGDGVLAGLGFGAWAMMAGTYLPMLRWYRLGWWRAPLLPLVAVCYAAMTVDSARRHRSGRGGEWKGRSR